MMDPPVQQQQPSNSNNIDPLGDLLGLGGNTSNNNNQQQRPSNNNMDPLGDLLGTSSSPTSMSSSNVSSPNNNNNNSNKPSPFEAYNNNGICATFNFAPSQGQGVCRVLAVFHNSNSYEINDFSFMIAVPKYIKLQFKPANGTKLLALSQNSITQKFQLTNTMYPQKPFIIRVQVVYTQNGQQMKDRSQVQFPDNCC